MEQACDKIKNMHLPDGLLSNSVNSACVTVSAAFFYFCNRAVSKELDETRASIAGAVTAFVFAAQMINFPIGFGASGHFLGAFFISLILGPHLGFISMTVILAIQSLFFADGGVIAMGANIFNMAVIGGFLSYSIFNLLNKNIAFFSTRAGFLIASTLTGYFSVVAASFACGLELAFSGIAPIEKVVPAITFIHFVIALGEAGILFTMLSFLLAMRPELFAGYLKGEKEEFKTRVANEAETI